MDAHPAPHRSVIIEPSAIRRRRRGSNRSRSGAATWNKSRPCTWRWLRWGPCCSPLRWAPISTPSTTWRRPVLRGPTPPRQRERRAQAPQWPWRPSGRRRARFNCSPIRLKTNVEPWRSVTGGNGQNRSHVHYKRRVLAAGPRLKQDPIDADMRILDHVLRKFRHADQLHVIRRQAMMALGRGVYIGSPIERQHGHIVHAIGSRIVPKMNTPGQVVLDRLLEQAGTVAYDAARQPKTRANEDPTPISHECGSIRCGSIHECEFTPAELQHCRGPTTLPRNYNIAAELQHCRGP